MHNDERPAVERTLDAVRRDVAEIDRQIIAGLATRERLAAEAVRFKRSAADITDLPLRANLLARIDRQAADAGVSRALAHAVYNAILDVSIPRQLELFANRHVEPTSERD
ncbi:chorismate mutase [Verticiella sediminum]|nr:chorismate mutase [Verticiella sediminum]